MEVLPNARIIKDRTDNYPVTVSVYANIDGEDVQLWGPGRQQLWFRKNGTQRSQAIAELKKACRGLSGTE